MHNIRKVFNKHTFADIASVLEKMFFSLYNDFFSFLKFCSWTMHGELKWLKIEQKIFARRIKEIFE
jgi:hypothetical protein